MLADKPADKLPPLYPNTSVHHDKLGGFNPHDHDPTWRKSPKTPVTVPKADYFCWHKPAARHCKYATTADSTGIKTK